MGYVNCSAIKQELKLVSSKDKAEVLQRFFKTGEGEYGEGDIFLGVSVPSQREVVKKYFDKISISETIKLLKSKIHEERLIALLLLVKKCEKNKQDQKTIFEAYLNNVNWINNWDLVDLSAPNIIGNYLLDKDRCILYDLAESSDLWKKRISIVATYSFIRNNDFDDTLKISKILLGDSHDLIHKAVGWMLREVGKRDINTLENFLKKYYRKMSRTTLRYAIERFDENKRLKYLKGEI